MHNLGAKADGGSGSCIPATHAANSDGVLKSRLGYSPALAIVVILEGVNQQKVNLYSTPFPSLCDSSLFYSAF